MMNDFDEVVAFAKSEIAGHIEGSKETLFNEQYKTRQTDVLFAAIGCNPWPDLPEPDDYLGYMGWCHAAVRLLRKGSQLPEPLRTFAADVLAGDRPMPRRSKGAPNKDRENMAVYMAIQAVKCEFPSMNIYRNEAQGSEGVSVLDAVAIAMRKLDKSPRSYSGIRSLYERLDKFRQPTQDGILFIAGYGPLK